MSELAAKAQPADATRQVTWRCVEGAASAAIVEFARDQDVDAIAMVTRGYATGHAAGRPATQVVEHATLPLIRLGPGTLTHPEGVKIKIDAAVRAADTQRVGRVHRVVIDLQQQALVGVVVLGRVGLARDIWVPLDFVRRVDDADATLELSVTHAELEQFPDYQYNEFDTPPAAWDQPSLAPTRVANGSDPLRLR